MKSVIKKHRASRCVAERRSDELRLGSQSTTKSASRVWKPVRTSDELAAFSLVEMLMALLVASLLMVALAPVMTKKFNESISVSGRVGPGGGSYHREWQEDGEWTVPIGVRAIKVTTIGGGGAGGGSSFGSREFTSGTNVSWKVPAGVKKIKVFMIGGGGAGASGGAGTGTRYTTVASQSVGSTTKRYYEAGNGTDTNKFSFTKTVTAPAMDSYCAKAKITNWTCVNNTSVNVTAGANMPVSCGSYRYKLKATACGGGGGSSSSKGGSGGYLKETEFQTTTSTLYITVGGGGGGGGYARTKLPSAGGYGAGGGGNGVWGGDTIAVGKSGGTNGKKGGDAGFGAGVDGESYTGSNKTSSGGGGGKYSDTYKGGKGGDGGIWGGGGGGGGGAVNSISDCRDFYGGGGGGGPTTISMASGTTGTIVFQVGGGGGGGGAAIAGNGGAGGGGGGGGYGGGGGGGGGGNQGDGLSTAYGAGAGGAGGYGSYSALGVILGYGTGTSGQVGGIGNSTSCSGGPGGNGGLGGGGYGGVTGKSNTDFDDDTYCSAGSTTYAAGKPGILELYTTPGIAGVTDALKCSYDQKPNGGGGGGGGQVWFGEIDVSAVSEIKITVGNGGTPSTYYGDAGGNGTASIIAVGAKNYTAAGGGGGKYVNSTSSTSGSAGTGGKKNTAELFNWTSMSSTKFNGLVGGADGSNGGLATGSYAGGSGGSPIDRFGNTLGVAGGGNAETKGDDATNKGGGGGGGGGSKGNAPGYGGKGASGYVYIEWGDFNGGGGASGEVVKDKSVWVTPGTSIKIRPGAGGVAKDLVELKDSSGNFDGYKGEDGNKGGDSYIVVVSEKKALAKGGSGGGAGFMTHGIGGNIDSSSSDYYDDAKIKSLVENASYGTTGNKDGGGYGGTVTEVMCPLLSELKKFGVGMGGCGGLITSSGKCQGTSANGQGINATGIGNGGGGGAVYNNGLSKNAQKGGDGSKGIVVIEWGD